jgi:hypothetical protein
MSKKTSQTKNPRKHKKKYVHPSLKVHAAPELKEEPETESITKMFKN